MIAVRKIYEMLVSVQDHFRGPVEDPLEDGISKLREKMGDDDPTLQDFLAAHREHQQALYYLKGLIDALEAASSAENEGR